ncbi:MAG TPA: hypothetical protein VIY27_00165 [Myxococcota bacterium]
MAQRVQLSKWSVRSEPDATREAYARIDCGGAESCGCEACFNFASARHLVYSAEVLDLFESLGIDPLLEAEARHDRCLEEGRHAYTACFYLVGEIADGPATTVARRGRRVVASLEAAGEGICVGFSADARDAPEAFRGLPVVRLEVSVVAPWVSNEPEPT